MWCFIVESGSRIIHPLQLCPPSPFWKSEMKTLKNIRDVKNMWVKKVRGPFWCPERKLGIWLIFWFLFVGDVPMMGSSILSIFMVWLYLYSFVFARNSIVLWLAIIGLGYISKKPCALYNWTLLYNRWFHPSPFLKTTIVNENFYIV